MKNVFIVTFVMFLAVVSKAGEVEKEFVFSNYQLEQQGDYQRVILDNTLQSGMHGQAVFPYVPVSLLLPPGEAAVSVEFYGEDEMILPGKHLLYPQQESQTLNDDTHHPFQKDENFYSTDTFFPSKASGKLITQYMNGYSFALTSFTPLRYNPATGELRLYRKVRIRILTQARDEAATALANLSSGEKVVKKVKRLAQNEKMITQYPPVFKSADDYQLLIITTDTYENSFEDLQAMYISRGIKSMVITKSYIVSNINGMDTQDKIRNYIIQEYQLHNIEYVLLGGDVELIPYRGFFCHVDSGSGYEDNGIPADLYYAGLDGNWNTDGDSHWGEPGEDDLLPEIGIGRFPFSNMTELNNLKHKSISYQNNPVQGEFTKPLLAGEFLYSSPDTWGKDYMELLVGFHDDNGYTTIGIPETNDIETLYEADNYWSGTDLRNKINGGKQFVHHVGHASETMVAHLSIGDITNSNFSGANGITHNYTFLQTHGCNCGSFDSDDCILEKMVTIQNFAAAVFGNSRYGWFNEGQTEGPAEHLHREMVDALYHEKLNHLGAAFVEAKTQTAPWVTAPGQWEEGALRWNFYDLNMLGDPALSLLTDEPISIETLYENTLPIGVNSLSVNVKSEGVAMEGFSCVLLKDNTISGLAITDDDGNAVINLETAFTSVGTAQLIVSGYNCLPTSYEVQIIPNEGPYVTMNEFSINDASGNNNGLADFGEPILLSIAAQNVGSQNVSGVTATLSSPDNYVNITDSTQAAGDITAGEMINLNDAFAFSIADDIADQHSIEFQIVFEGASKETWTSYFSIVANAPFFTIYELSIDDSGSGNGDGILDAGETADILISTINTGHAASDAITALLETSSEYLTINDGSFSNPGIGINDSMDAVFNVTAATATPSGTPAFVDYSILSGAYTNAETFTVVIGEVPVFLMQDGSLTLCAGKFYDTGGASGEYQNDEDLTLTFYPATENAMIKMNFQNFNIEGSYDFLYIHDGVNINAPQVSGSPFTGVTLPTEIIASNDAGAITVHFTSDYSVTSSGWYADVSCDVNSAVDDSPATNSFAVFPNPVSQILYFRSPVEGEINIFNLTGEKVFGRFVEKNILQAIDIHTLNSGLYFIELKTNTSNHIEKFQKI
jgi:hypothetical protein